MDWSAMSCSSFVGVNTFDLGDVIQLIQLTLTLKMTTAQVVETSVTVNNNSPIQNYVHPDDHTHPPYEMTPGFKPFTITVYATALMVVEAASPENTLSVSFGHDICLSVLALSIADHPLLRGTQRQIFGKISVWKTI